MSKIDDGGPAFPVSTRPTDVVEGEEARVPYSHQDSVITWTFGGMTLRDFFAAKAMSGFCVNADVDSFGVPETAAQSYAIADAMIAARKAGA